MRDKCYKMRDKSYCQIPARGSRIGVNDERMRIVSYGMRARYARAKVGIMDILKAIEREGLMRATVSSANKQESRPEWYKKAVEFMAENRLKCSTSEDYLRLGAQVIVLLIEDNEPNLRTVLRAIKATFDTLPRKKVTTKAGREVEVIEGIYCPSQFRSTAEGRDYRGVYGVASILLHNYKLAEQLRSEYRKLLAGSVMKPVAVEPTVKAELKRLVK
ncbi:TPA_asm: hypothetical protein vir526_00061 [Caudoviricetes sp. vir526]|nr:TPA_asm: hypothetical protein vir526_00061 [Caudoviricetes sp. vir526]